MVGGGGGGGLSMLIGGNLENSPCGGGGVDGVEGRLYGANSGQCVTRPCSHWKTIFELILIRNGKFYSLEKIHE
jgi:hypothetical protein